MVKIIYFLYFTLYSLINKSQILYFRIIDQNLFISINRKINSLNYSLNPLLHRFANTIIVNEYKTKIRIDKGLTDIKRKEKIIVSLTSFPPRINTLWICIESLLRQTLKPDEIILWLADSQFNGLSSLPNSLIELQRRGLTIRFCDDLKAHKKYYYSFKEYPDDIVITVDDDVIYPPDTIKELIKLHKKYPKTICCNFAVFTIINNNNKIDTCNKWLGFFSDMIRKPSFLLVQTGVNGVLYPPKSINNEVFNKEVFKEICFYNDDLWLKVMSILNNTKVIQTACFPGHFFGINNSQKERLTDINVSKNLNDIQVRALLKKYKIWQEKALKEFSNEFK